MPHILLLLLLVFERYAVISEQKLVFLSLIGYGFGFNIYSVRLQRHIYVPAVTYCETKDAVLHADSQV